MQPEISLIPELYNVMYIQQINIWTSSSIELIKHNATISSFSSVKRVILQNDFVGFEMDYFICGES